MNSECHNLDAYLANDLSVELAVNFERHMQLCSVCREAIDEERWVDDLLQSPIRLQLERAPSELVETLKSTESRRRRRVRLAACGLAAAAMLMVAVGLLEHNRQAVDRLDQVANVGDVNVQAEAPPKATFVGGANMIVVPIESHHADVTIVRIYPTFRPRYESQTAAAEPDAASRVTWSEYSNGG